MHGSRARVALTEIPVGATARIVSVGGGRPMIRRFTALGLRVGSEVVVSQRRGQGLVVISGNTRIALGPEMVRHLAVQLEDEDH